MVEANTQEYAFNFLQQSLKNKIDDTEVCETESLYDVICTVYVCVLF